MRTIQEVVTTDREAVDKIVARARAVPAEAWSTPAAPGKWSPGQVVEHVVISYGDGQQALLGASSMKALPRIVRPLIRKLMLPKILDTGRFPKGAKAPASLQPAAFPGDREVLLGRLRTQAEAFRRTALELTGHGQSHVVHPVFGKLPVSDYVLLCARHTAHHTAQIPAGAAAR